MRILVISDSHKNTAAIDKVLSAEPAATSVFFLGDNIRDIEDFDIMYPDKKFFSVSGNCDWGSLIPCSGLEKICGINIFYTHGHNYGVKYGTERLLEAAKKSDSKIILYGHTHIPEISYADGRYIVNPGSLSEPRGGYKKTYAVIDIEPNGILPTIKEF